LGKWEDRLFINCIAIAVGTGAIVLYGLAAIGVSFHWTVRPVWTMAIVLGGILFGTGIAIGGYVPGTEWMALGEGRCDAIYALFGGLLGAATWTLIYQTIFDHWLLTYLNFGQIYFAGKVDTNLTIGFIVAIIWAAIMFTLAYTLPRYKKGKSCVCLSTHKGYMLSPEEEKKYLCKWRLNFCQKRRSKICQFRRLNFYHPFSFFRKRLVGICTIWRCGI